MRCCCACWPGDETVGGEKQPYDPRIHFVLINEAYKAANPGNKELARLARRAARDLRQDLRRQAAALHRGLQQAEGSDQAVGQQVRRAPGAVARREARTATPFAPAPRERCRRQRKAHWTWQVAWAFFFGWCAKPPVPARGRRRREIRKRPGCSRLACPSGLASPRTTPSGLP